VGNGEGEDLNPILTPYDERSLGNRLYETVTGYPDEFRILLPEEYPELYNYLKSTLYMVEVTTQIKGKFDWQIAVLNSDGIRNAYA
jgi:hypothetical protein